MESFKYIFEGDTLTHQTLFRGLWLSGVWLYMWKKINKSFCVSRVSCTKSTKLPQAMSLKSLLGGAKVYKFKNAGKEVSLSVRCCLLLISARSSKFLQNHSKVKTLCLLRFNSQCFALTKWGAKNILLWLGKFHVLAWNTNWLPQMWL